MKEVQEIMLRLAEIGSFNGYDGEHVVKELKGHTDLWDSVIFGRTETGITLRDLTHNHYNADTMWILCAPGKEKEMMGVALKEFNADEVHFMQNPERFLGSYGTQDKVLYVWWD